MLLVVVDSFHRIDSVPCWAVCWVEYNLVLDSSVCQEWLVEGAVGIYLAFDSSMLFLDLALLEGSGIGRGVGSGMGSGVGSGIGRASVSSPSIPPSLRSVRAVVSWSRIELEDRLVLV